MQSETPGDAGGPQTARGESAKYLKTKREKTGHLFG